MSKVTKPKAYLVRGIDKIPEEWEMASFERATEAINNSYAQLGRLAMRHPKLAPPLRRAMNAMTYALDQITGGFPRNAIEPRARKIARVLARVNARLQGD